MKKKLKKFEEIIKEKKLIDASLEILQWDLETTAPKKGKELIADASISFFSFIISSNFFNFFFINISPLFYVSFYIL